MVSQPIAVDLFMTSINLLINRWAWYWSDKVLFHQQHLLVKPGDALTVELFVVFGLFDDFPQWAVWIGLLLILLLEIVHLPVVLQIIFFLSFISETFVLVCWDVSVPPLLLYQIIDHLEYLISNLFEHGLLGIYSHFVQKANLLLICPAALLICFLISMYSLNGDSDSVPIRND